MEQLSAIRYYGSGKDGGPRMEGSFEMTHKQDLYQYVHLVDACVRAAVSGDGISHLRGAVLWRQRVKISQRRERKSGGERMVRGKRGE